MFNALRSTVGAGLAVIAVIALASPQASAEVKSSASPGNSAVQITRTPTPRPVPLQRLIRRPWPPLQPCAEPATR